MFLFSLQNGLDLVQLQADDDPVASVRVFSWFDNPSVELMYRICVRFVSLGDGVEMLQKFEVFVVFDSVLDVESEGQVLKYILVLSCVVLGHCLEESLFVADHEIVRKVVVQSESRPNFSEFSLGYAHQFGTDSEIFLDFTFLIDVFEPVVFPTLFL
jgi:hypothetical protein